MQLCNKHWHISVLFPENTFKYHSLRHPQLDLQAILRTHFYQENPIEKYSTTLFDNTDDQ